MNLDVDNLISFFRKNTNKFHNSPLDEQEETSTTPPPSSPPPPSSSTSGSGGTSSGKTPRKWSGAARGKANPTGNTVWASGRQFGKTYMNDPKSVWNTGVKRGPANQLYYD